MKSVGRAAAEVVNVRPEWFEISTLQCGFKTGQIFLSGFSRGTLGFEKRKSTSLYLFIISLLSLLICIYYINTQQRYAPLSGPGMLNIIKGWFQNGALECPRCDHQEIGVCHHQELEYVIFREHRSAYHRRSIISISLIIALMNLWPINLLVRSSMWKCGIKGLF